MNAATILQARRAIAFALGLALISGFFPSLAQDQPMGTLTGLILDPSGNPSEGFRLVFRTEEEALEFISPPSDAMGKYTLPLPAGESYLLVAAIAPDGTRLDVPQLPPIPVEEGARRMDVRFSYPKKPGSEGQEKERSRLRELPWWRIGGATAAVVLFATAVFDDDPERPASPSIP